MGIVLLYFDKNGTVDFLTANIIIMLAYYVGNTIYKIEKSPQNRQFAGFI